MMSKARSAGLSVTLVVVLGIGQTHLSAAPMGTAFTYQGRFTDGSSPANGNFDFQFSLFDAATAGNQVGTTVTKDDLSVSEGYFTTALDFGSSPFTGDARWLQIAVRPGVETGAYAILMPRHELTPTPYTLYTNVQGTANHIPKFTGSYLADSLMYESDGRVGMGTTSPGTYAHGAAQLAIYHSSYPGIDLANANRDWLLWMNGDNLRLYEAGGPGGAAGTDRVTFQSGGNVGVGTTNPQNRLHVNSGAANNVVLFESADPGAVILLKDSGTGGGGEAIARSTNDLDLRTNDTPRLTVQSSTGYVGIGTTGPTQMLDVSGTVRCVSLIQTSDAQLKTDVQSLSGVLAKLDQIRAVSFRWNEKARALGAKTDIRQIGVLAQELEQVFPELVVTPEPTTADKLLANYSEEMLTADFRQRLQADADKTQYKAVRYSELTAVLLEAVKELRAQNRSLEQRIQALESKVK